MKTLKILSICLAIILTGCDSNSSESSKKTSFNNCDELIEYVQFKSCSELEEEWGEGQIGESWSPSGGIGMKMLVIVTWDKIKLNNKPVIIWYEKSTLTGLPSRFEAVPCDEIEN